MKDANEDLDPDEIAAELIAREGVADVRRMIVLSKRLEAAFTEFKTDNDGGLRGALSCAEAFLDYLGDKKPDWARIGLLNPLAEIIVTLRALKDGGTSQILTANSHRINRQRLTLSDRAARGIISALVDVVMTKRPCSEDEACRVIARALRSRDIPVSRGLNEFKDATTVKNWRKIASAGRVDVDPDATTYACMKERLLARSGPISKIIDEMLDGLFGVRPPIVKS
jgi:hypothetical protein